ncbi:MAG TPA: threonine-phosphate decarboxylase [Verrucomicrobia bacterium]|nr:threonine-phosphate decarboxylase [Verrucomicrobiota bacterium]
MVDAHGGNLQRLAAMVGTSPEALLDFSANINPLGQPDWLRQVISRHVSDLRHYPDPECRAFTEAVCNRYGVVADEVLTGNGTSELLYLLVRSCGMQRALIPVPCYSDYLRAAEQAGLPVTELTLLPADGFRLDFDRLDASLSSGTLVMIGTPNNPTGRSVSADQIRAIALAHPDCRFLIDEAFGDFVADFESLTNRRPPNVAVLLSLTKMFAVPGLRPGCAVSDAAWVQIARQRQPPWSVNTLAQAVGTAALRDTDYPARTRIVVARERDALYRALNAVPGLTVFPGEANFLLLRLADHQPDAPTLADRLLKHDGIAIRVCDNFRSLDCRWIRVAVRTAEENARLLDALRLAVAGTSCSGGGGASRRTPALMFQGTGSNAGKSVLTAAMCRILLQDGFRVAPFKAQNMSLNSFVTRDGREMGRAQVVQAQASRREPDVRMNPVLLKPNSDTGSQVIVNGRPVGNMRVNEYIRYKPEAFKAVCRAYDALSAEVDVVVIEGAGSPGEVNLKAHDIVNMTMADYAKAPVLLVGDIDRGGVFAAFIGTMDVLTERERKRVAGFVVNRFRGQESLLQDALDYTLRYTGKPVLGVIPYLASLGLPEEDSVSFKDASAREGVRPEGQDGKVDVAVIDLPHISNFTDLDALRNEPDVHLRVVRSAAHLGTPDVLILPGSKNTLADLDWLKQSGLAGAILALEARHTTEIVGICGGFQMLGHTIADPGQIESGSGQTEGLKLLAVDTEMQAEKTLERTVATHIPSGLEVRGYEIHHGKTTSSGIAPLFACASGQDVGLASPDGSVWGTYLHGVFDADPFRRWFIDRLRQRCGLAPVGRVLSVYDIEPALDRLADIVRQHLQIETIYRLMGVR